MAGPGRPASAYRLSRSRLRLLTGGPRTPSPHAHGYTQISHVLTRERADSSATHRGPAPLAASAHMETRSDRTARQSTDRKSVSTTAGGRNPVYIHAIVLHLPPLAPLRRKQASNPKGHACLTRVTAHSRPTPLGGRCGPTGTLGTGSGPTPPSESQQWLGGRTPPAHRWWGPRSSRHPLWKHPNQTNICANQGGCQQVNPPS